MNKKLKIKCLVAGMKKIVADANVDFFCHPDGWKLVGNEIRRNGWLQ